MHIRIGIPVLFFVGPPRSRTVFRSDYKTSIENIKRIQMSMNANKGCSHSLQNIYC